jgi:hypothetical protein
MIGEVIYDKIELEDSSIGISNTSQLLKLLNITSGEVLLSYIKNNKIFLKLIISDTKFTVNYTLADTLTIPKSGAYTGPQEYNLETTLDKEMIASLVKAKSALDDSDTVVINPYKNLDGEFQLELVFGGNVEYSNKISYYLSNFIQNNVPSDFKLGFNSELFKEILSVNKDADNAKLCINLEGLMKLEFETESTKSTYYIVSKEI